ARAVHDTALSLSAAHQPLDHAVFLATLAAAPALHTFSIFPDVRAKPGCAGRAGIHSALRLVVASTERRVGPDEAVPAGERGEIIAGLASDEAVSSYWNRPHAAAPALPAGWYFTSGT